MKFRLLILFVAVFTIQAARAQGQPLKQYSDVTDVKFVLKGKMYVGNYTPGQTSLYIDGSAKFISAATDAAGTTLISQQGITELKGDFVDALGSSAGEDVLFSPTTSSNTKFVFSGKDKVQTILRDPAAATGYAKNYIAFPTVELDQSLSAGYDLNNMGYVSVDTSASISVDNLILNKQITANVYNRFAVEASYVSAAKQNGIKFGQALIKTLTDKVGGDLKGSSQVNLRLYDTSNPSTNRPTGATGNARYLTGLASPFEQLGNDYTFYQVTIDPKGANISHNSKPLTNPLAILKAGRGYFFAQEVSQYEYNDISSNWGSADNDRFRGGYTFGRMLFQANSTAGTGANKKTGFSQYTTSTISERFNTSDVIVDLVQGINFVGNPFMAPIDLADIVDPTINNRYTEVQSTAGSEVFNLTDFDVKTIYSASNTGGNVGIRPRFWIPQDGTVEADNPASPNLYTYKIKYYDAAASGGTLGLEGTEVDDFKIAPLQVFCLQANGATTITLKPSIRTLTSKKPLVRSSSGGRVDEILLQAVNLETGAEDRMSVVLRDNAQLGSDDYDASKGLADVLLAGETSTKVASKDLIDGLIYTKNAAGKALLTNGIPTDTKELAVYITTPATESQRMVIKPYRLNTLNSINKVWLEDRYEGKTVELTENTEYEFVSSPLSEDAAADNRFVLRFAKNDEITPIDPNAELSCYYINSTLYIKGLNDKDVNSVVYVYDMLGRLLMQKTITTVPTMTYPKSLPTGTYVVKIAGNRNHTTKIASLQN